MKRVILYGNKLCPACELVKQYLGQYNVKLVYKNVAETKNAEECFEVSKQMSIPVTVIEGNVIIGFDEKKLKEKLEK